MSDLKLQGRIAKILDLQTGVSKAGKDWKKRDFVISTNEQYEKTVCFTLFGDKSAWLDNYKIGQMVEVAFNVESREYKGNYFHNINAWMLKKLEVESQDVQNAETILDAPPVPDDDKDLPF